MKVSQILSVAAAAVLTVLPLYGAGQGGDKAASPAVKFTNEQLKTIKINGKTNKSALSYLENEEMIFTFNLDAGNLPLDGYFLAYTRRGDDGKSFSGKVPAKETLTVKTSLDRPGFVSVAVKLVNANGKPLVAKFGNRQRHIGFYAGTAVKAETLKDCGEPADFDEFWAKQRKRLDAVPFKGLVKEQLVRTGKNSHIYAVTIPCVGRPATGYMCVPKNAKPKSLPVEIVFFGYGAKRHSAPQDGRTTKIQFYLNAHGQELEREDAYYKEFFQSIRTKEYSYGFNPEENKDPETAFFNGMCLRLMRALEYLKTRPEWDGRHLRASGGSQGGLQTMWAAALDQDINVAYPSITWCCDLSGTEKAGRIHGPWRIKYTPALDYYDPVFMAKRIKKAVVHIRRAGLGDYTCPPSGLAISYNNLATPRKSICWVQGSDHGFVPEKSEVIVWKSGK